ncbi:MAG TPA: hypothetical protein VHX65_17890 [Pirellulales bacterium]|nr:hypothetical protein [Pirellulales bacterium]
MKSTFFLLCVAAVSIAGNTGCCGCNRGYGTTYAAPAYPAPAYATTPPVVYQPPVVSTPPAVVQMPSACSQCAPVCGCQ